jgi:hypothetical protein
MITVLCPSRGRPDQLGFALATLFDTAAEPVSVHTVVGFDADDPELSAGIATCQDIFVSGRRVDWAVFPERHGYGQIWAYYRTLSLMQPIEEWTLLWNDDARMASPGWDDMLRAVPADKMVADFENYHSPGLITFPAVRRWAINLLGGSFIPNGLETVHVDSVWQEIGRRSGTASALIPAYVQHLRPDLIGGQADTTYLEGRLHLDHGGFFSPAFQEKLDRAAARVAGQLLIQDVTG